MYRHSGRNALACPHSQRGKYVIHQPFVYRRAVKGEKIQLNKPLLAGMIALAAIYPPVALFSFAG